MIGKSSADSLFVTSHLIKYEINDSTFVLFFELVPLLLILVERQTMYIDFAHITAKRSLSLDLLKKGRETVIPWPTCHLGEVPETV